MAQLSMLLDAPITKVRRAAPVFEPISDEMVVGWLLELEGGDVIHLFSSRAIKNRPRFSRWHEDAHRPTLAMYDMICGGISQGGRRGSTGTTTCTRWGSHSLPR